MSERHVIIAGGGLAVLATDCHAHGGPCVVDGCIQWLTRGVCQRDLVPGVTRTGTR